MRTLLLHDDPADIRRAADLIQAGQLVAFPTETVYGLGANALDEDAVRSIFAAKGRPADNPLIVHISNIAMLANLAAELPDIALRLAQRFWPGPLTIVLPKHRSVPLVTSGGLQTVGIRMPAHPAARALIQRSGCPIAAPSANRSGKPSPTTAAHVMDDMKGRISAVLDGGTCEGGVESTVICLDDADTIHLLRPGLISAEDLKPYAKQVYIDEAVYKQLSPDAKAASPGMKYKHYAPKAKILPVDAPDFAAFAGWVQAHTEKGCWCLLFDSDPEVPGVPSMRYGDDGKTQAHYLFLRFRELDAAGAKVIYVRMPGQTGAGLSVYNRLMRAAGFEVITV